MLNIGFISSEGLAEVRNYRPRMFAKWRFDVDFILFRADTIEIGLRCIFSARNQQWQTPATGECLLIFDTNCSTQNGGSMSISLFPAKTISDSMHEMNVKVKINGVCVMFLAFYISTGLNVKKNVEIAQ